jgi:hypothetical protein
MPISTEEWAYFSGFLDGEGCIFAYKSAKRSRRPKITIAQKDPVVLEWIQATFGGGLWHSKNSGRDYWLWSSDNLELTRFILRGTIPHLKLKTNQARVALRLCNDPRPFSEEQDKLYRLLKKLKRVPMKEQTK